MRAVDPAHFPNVFSALREAGLDPARELVPVAPAAHYMMGGIVADLDARSSVPGLYAVGEASCTGLHGANRLASNSLSECFVFAARAVDEALGRAGEPLPAPEPGEAEALQELPAPPEVSGEIRQALWLRAGIVRDAEGLEGLLAIEHPLVRCIARCALERTESRGAQVRSDHPERDPSMDGRHVVVDGSGELGSAGLGVKRSFSRDRGVFQASERSLADTGVIKTNGGCAPEPRISLRTRVGVKHTMYQFSRAIYRELAPRIIEPPTDSSPGRRQHRGLSAPVSRSSRASPPNRITSPIRRGRSSATSAASSRCPTRRTS